jgi:hypothetical protein
MTSILTNEDKLSILNQHIKNIEYSIYNLELDILEYSVSLNKEASYETELNQRLTAANAKKDLLIAEKEALNGTATGE